MNDWRQWCGTEQERDLEYEAWADDKFLCVYCGKSHVSENGTGSDIRCCGEISHCERVEREPK